MKLSEAIRLGAMLKPGGTGWFYKPETGATCALGAALDAIGALNMDDPLNGAQNRRLYAEWPVMTRSLCCPGCGAQCQTMLGAVWCLNDGHKWTREQIADWVETIEQQQAQAAEPQKAEALV